MSEPTEAQLELLRDKYVLWDRAAREGHPELRDYNRRAADALKAVLSVAQSNPPSDQQGREQVIVELCEALEAFTREDSDGHSLSVQMSRFAMNMRRDDDDSRSSYLAPYADFIEGCAMHLGVHERLASAAISRARSAAQ